MSRLSTSALPAALLLAFLAGAPPPLLAQPTRPAAAEALARIRAEGLERSQVDSIFHVLTDVIGPRLSGTSAYDRAAEWARDRFTAWGLEDARLEPFQFGRGWSLEKLTLEMTGPRYMPLTGYPEAWTPSTDGVVEAPVIYVGDLSAVEIRALGERLRGAIVLTHLPQTEFRQDRPQPAATADPVRTGNPPVPMPQSTTPLLALNGILDEFRPALKLRPGSGEYGTLFVEGSRGTPINAIPSVVLTVEHYNMLARMVDGGTPVQMRVELRSRFEEGVGNHNVIAEIPGSDPELRDEIVFISAHLDSWHAATGATDNADGAASVMEAARILSAIGTRPRRTIRVALWGAEEQGLLGSRSYVANHLPDPASRDRVSVMLNDDPGSGRTWGFYMEQNHGAMSLFDAWLEPLRDLGMVRNVVEGIGSTDHVSFAAVGVPAFTAIKDFPGYDSRSRHGNADFFERTSLDGLRQSAVVMASFAWQAAQADAVVPRLPGSSARTPGPPLFIIDNVVSDSTTFARLDPDEIDDISIYLAGGLPDIQRIYGVPAPNGAVRVYTKPGPMSAIKAGLSEISRLQAAYFRTNGRFATDPAALPWSDPTGDLSVTIDVAPDGRSWSAAAIHRRHMGIDPGREAASVSGRAEDALVVP